MTGYDDREQEDTLRPLDRLETELIEADIQTILSASANACRVYDEDAEQPDEADVIGWTVYGGVHIDRHMLPVCGYLTSGDEDPDHTAHRRQILEVIAGAYDAGRLVRGGGGTPLTEPGTIGFDIVVPEDASDAEVAQAMTDALRGVAAGRVA